MFSSRIRPFFLLLPVFLSVAFPPGCGSRQARTGPPNETTVDRILSSLESTLMAMQGRDYRGIWTRLSAASRNRIVDDTRKAIAQTGREDPSPGAIESDFREGGPLARNYWDGFLLRFDPNAALQESRWEMGTGGEDEAYVLITHKGAEKPAVVRLFREDGGWKVGLVETFWDQPAR